MVHRHAAPTVTLAVVLGGASVFAVAQMGPNDDRRLPYQGTLELGGTPAPTANYDMRFGLFPTANADASCLTTDPSTCAVWGEEQTVTVTAGAFSVALGDEAAIDDDVLGRAALFLGIAVSGPDDAGAFTLLGSKQEILAVPFAARAAAAKDYKVTGALTATSVTADSVTADSVTADSVSTDAVDLASNNGNIAIGTTGSGLDVRFTGTATDNASLFRVRNNAGDAVFRVENDEDVEVNSDLIVSGTTTLQANTTIQGTTTVNGPLSFQCPSAFVRVGQWCIEDTLRGGNGISYSGAVAACHNQGASICPMSALAACDVFEPLNRAGTADAVCTDITDEDQWLWTANFGPINDANALSNVQVFNGQGNDATNEGDVADDNATTFTGDPLRVICCRNSGGI